MTELEIHSAIEEEIFYPAVRRQEDAGDLMEDTMNEADEEHHVADLLMAELKKMRSADARFAAKFTVLAENVKHHIQEEESEIFTKAAEAGMERLQELGLQMEQRKLELMNGAKPRKASRTKATTRKPSRSRTMPAARKARTTRVARSKRATTSGVKKSARKTTTSAKKTVRRAATRTKTAARKATSRAKTRTRGARTRAARAR
jgi:hypothetical protein